MAQVNQAQKLLSQANVAEGEGSNTAGGGVLQGDNGTSTAEGGNPVGKDTVGHGSGALSGT